MPIASYNEIKNSLLIYVKCSKFVKVTFLSKVTKYKIHLKKDFIIFLRFYLFIVDGLVRIFFLTVELYRLYVRLYDFF